MKTFISTLAFILILGTLVLSSASFAQRRPPNPGPTLPTPAPAPVPTPTPAPAPAPTPSPKEAELEKRVQDLERALKNLTTRMNEADSKPSSAQVRTSTQKIEITDPSNGICPLGGSREKVYVDVNNNKNFDQGTDIRLYETSSCRDGVYFRNESMVSSKYLGEKMYDYVHTDIGGKIRHEADFMIYAKYQRTEGYGHKIRMLITQVGVAQMSSPGPLYYKYSNCGGTPYIGIYEPLRDYLYPISTNGKAWQVATVYSKDDMQDVTPQSIFHFNSDKPSESKCEPYSGSAQKMRMMSVGELGVPGSFYWLESTTKAAFPKGNLGY